jgi:hypothetical protein
MPSPFEKLPTELLVLVAEQAEAEDLPALRLTSRAALVASFDAFLEAHFTHRDHLLTLHSLDNLIRITEHPHLRSEIKSLMFRVCELADEDIDDDPCGDPYPYTEIEHEVCRECYQEYCVQRNKRLAAALSNLAKAGIVPSLTLSSFGGSCCGRECLEVETNVALQQRRSHYQCESSVENFDAIPVLMAAIEAHFPVAELTLLFGGHETSVEDPQTAKFALILPSLPSLKSLRLVSHDEEPYNDAVIFRTITDAASHVLTDLTVVTMERELQYQVHYLKGTFASCNLVKIDIVCFPLTSEAEQLQELLSRYRGTLAHVAWAGHFADTDTIEEFARCPHLTTLEVKPNKEQLGCAWNSLVGVGKRFVGKEEVSKGLQFLHEASDFLTHDDDD